VTALYYIAITLLLLVVWPVLIFSSKARFGVWQKLGFIPRPVRERLKSSYGKPIWFHCVSVGEFNAGYPLIKAFHEKYPSHPVVVSTTTGTGQQLAAERVGEIAQVIYFPYDTFFSVKSWLAAISPALFVIVETEIWPGLISQCKDRGVPVVIVNGRISPRSFKSYTRIKPFFQRYVKMISRIGAQTENEADRYRSLTDGLVPIETMGNLKCDGLQAKPSEEIAQLRKSLEIGDHDLVFIAGSTHEGEETAVLSAYTQLLKQMPEKTIRLIIAPRHPQRFDRAAELIKSAGLTVLRHSRAERFKSDFDVYLIDSIGHLASFYGIATVAFVGGTIAPVGGHNVLEPYTYKVPVLAGPRLEKTRDFARLLQDRDALFVVKNANEMAQELKRLLSDDNLRREIGNRGNQLLLDSQGAVKKGLVILEETLSLHNGHMQNAQQSSDSERGVRA
jgi:3-deoxy-D-manno-octulosonic-acid transferase